MISRRSFDWDAEPVYPNQRPYLRLTNGKEPIPVNHEAIKKGRKRGPIKGGQTRTVESLIRRLAAQGIK